MTANAGTVRYRLAHVADAASIATLHAVSWRRAYRGMLPDAFLDKDVFAERAVFWQERFGNPDDNIVTLTILAELNGELVGFGHSIAGEDEKYGTLLDNLHVLPKAQRLGIGTRLMAETAAWLEESGNRPSMYLWVLENNLPARRFYEALGGQPAGHGTSNEGGASVASLRFWWPELDRLSDHLPEEHQPVIAGRGVGLPRG